MSRKWLGVVAMLVVSCVSGAVTVGAHHPDASIAGPRQMPSVDLAAVRHVDAKTSVDIQMALAESAGPAVGGAATIYVLGETGYRRVREGTNGFSCLVTRQRVDTVEPECYDREGSATTLKARLYVEEQRAKGKSDKAIDLEMEAAYTAGRLIAPRKPGLVYMMSDYNYVLDPDSGHVIHFPGHLMFYAPYATPQDVGTGPGAPFLVNPGRPDALMIVVPAPHR